ncbi:phosphatidylglycerol lysyltransferase domain-containing protein [Methanosarcina barkeri]|uniref:phosphatidylglycerol lysyltransferase domain-containing protein n=1 Tax=Methanosarcina barkeri TaxID=2208 RepID=UPI001FB26C00|nr:phosphatidylglycerol lysyltransferase domain-containing protein [Methanosarcina barkeri]
MPGAEEMELAKKLLIRVRKHLETWYLPRTNICFLMMKSRLFLMYGVSGKTWVAMGDIVGTSNHAKELIWDFYEMSKLHQGRAAFYEVSEKYIPVYLDLGLTLIKIGEEAKVPLEAFTLEGSASKDFRYTVRNVEKKRILV